MVPLKVHSQAIQGILISSLFYSLSSQIWSKNKIRQVHVLSPDQKLSEKEMMTETALSALKQQKQ